MARLARFLIVLLALLCVSAVAGAATQYYVRPGGSNANTGLADNDATAWADPNYAINHMNAGAGDDLTIADGTYGPVTFPTAFQCPDNSTDPNAGCVIKGTSRTLTTISPAATDVAGIMLGGINKAGMTRNVKLELLHVLGGDHFAISCYPWTGPSGSTGVNQYCQNIYVQHVNLDGFDNMGPPKNSTSNTVTEAAFVVGLSCASVGSCTTGPRDNITLDDVTIDGNESICITNGNNTYSACGSATSAAYINATYTTIKNSTIKDLQGSFGRSASHYQFIDNYVEHVYMNDEDIGYNLTEGLVAGNVFNEVAPIHGGTGQGQGVVKMRRTSGGANPVSMVVMNNTFIAPPLTCNGVCAPNTVSPLWSKMNPVISSRPDSAAAFGEFSILRNIFKGFGTLLTTNILVDNTTAFGNCPSPIRFSGNVSFGATNWYTFTEPAACIPSTWGRDTTKVQTNPNLNSSFAPGTATDPECFPGGPEYTAWNGRTLTQWGGAEQGACTGSAPDCGNGTKEGFEDCDTADFGGVSCGSLGFTSGNIACTSDCKYNTAGCVAGSPAFVQAASNIAGNQNTVVMGVAPGAGHLLVLCSSRRATAQPGVSAVTQTGVTWNPVRTGVFFNPDAVDFWYGLSGAGASATITVTGLSGSTALTVAEFSGISTNAPLDSSASTTGAAASVITTPSISLAETNELAVACFGQANSDAGLTWSAPQESFTLETGAQKIQGGGGTGASSAITYKLLSGSTGIFTGLTSSQSDVHGQFIAGFKRPSLSSASAPFCTNYIVESGESCDVEDLNGATCVSLGFTGGTLRCSGTCSFDTTSCTGGSGCTNTIKDGSETDVDCGGGVCPDCPVTKACLVAGDCISGRCDANVCRSCTDGVTSGAETDTDCGGGICPACADGETCAANSDCASNLCTALVCTANPTCVDGIKNGAETDVDCGGGTCPGCEITQDCAANSDCLSNRCDSLICRTCFDNVKSGAESDVDCGGAGCAACVNGKTCTTNGNCQSNFCSAGVCAPQPTGANCTDTIKNGAETDVDCGGGTCPDCSDTKVCAANSDCLSNRCDSLVCRSCADSLKTGSETDIDCGGGSATGCQACAVTKTCSTGTDCQSGRCDSSICRSCTDGLKTGTETDVDCGGVCPACQSGQNCSADADCLNGTCTNGVCSSQSIVTNPGAPSRTVTAWTVRTDGNDANCKGSKDRAYDGGGKGSNCAFKTLGKAVAVARCGDTVTLKPGTHSTTTQTATAACTTCSGGLYSYDTMAVANSKECAANSVLTIRGERGPEGSYVSILDGGGTIEQAIKVQNSRSVVVRDIKAQNFIGTDPNNDAVVGIWEIADSDHITFTKNRITDLSADGAGAEILTDESDNLLISENYIMSSHPFILAFLGSDGNDRSQSRARDNTIIRSGYPRSGVGSSAHIAATQLRDITFRGNYLGHTSTSSGSSLQNYGLFLNNTRDMTVQGNVFNDIQVVGGTGYITTIGTAAGCGGATCNDKALISGNSFMKSSANSETTFILLFSLVGAGCKGTQVYNNLFASTSGASTDIGMTIACDGDDAAGGQDARADYNMFSNVAKPLVFSGSNWTCPSLACTSHTTKDEHVSTHDVHNTSDPGFFLSGSAPYPYFGIKTGGTARNAGYNGYCWVAPEDALCDIGAFEMGGGPGSGLPPGRAPQVTVPTSAGVN